MAKAAYFLDRPGQYFDKNDVCRDITYQRILTVGRRIDDFLSKVSVFEPEYLNSAHENFVMLTMMTSEIIK